MRWFALLVLLLLPLAQAGSADDPEITDPDDDGHPVSEKDLVKAWIEPAALEDGAPALWFRIETAGDFEHAPALFALHERYRIAFKVDGEGSDEWYIALSPTRGSTSAVVTTVPNGPEAVSCKLASAPAGEAAPLADEVVVGATFDAENQFGCIVGYEALGMQAGQAITDFYVEHLLVTRGPLSGAEPTGGDNIPYTVVETFDRAPDTGFGRDYQTAAPAPLVSYLDAAFPVEVQQEFTNTTSAAYQVNWTSPGGDLELQAVFEATQGSVDIQVLVGNESVLATLTEAGVYDFSAAPGDAVILIEYVDFIGHLNLTIVPVQAEPAQEPESFPEEEPLQDEHHENDTVHEGLDDDKDTPMPWVGAVAGVAVAAAIRRRH